MNADVETQLRATLEEQAGVMERMDVGLLADRVMARGRARRRRRAIGAAAAAVFVVVALVAVPAWVSGTHAPVRPTMATQLPEPSVTGRSAVPSHRAIASYRQVLAWFQGLPEAQGPVSFTGDPWGVLEIVPGDTSNDADESHTVTRLRATGQVLMTGKPRGAALDSGRHRVAVAAAVPDPKAGPSLTITLMVFDADTGRMLSRVSGLDSGTRVSGWLDGRVVLDVYASNWANRVAWWDPDAPEAAPVDITAGRVLDVAESGHRILVEGPGARCSQVWEVIGKPHQALEECGMRLVALSDDGRRGFIDGRYGIAPAMLDVWSGAQVALKLPGPVSVASARWSADDRVVLSLTVWGLKDGVTVVCEPDDGSCARVVPSP
ncbi:MAG TPA: hypothetical protein VLC50_06100 [Actinomycetes bacterium]|nr:hypothetical protein [Actinomycetes bacterium]